MDRLNERNTISKTRGRLRIISVCLILFLSLLIYNLFGLTVLNHAAYKNKVLDQITTSSKIVAKRGIIYDRDMNVLATDKTTYRIFTSTRQLSAYKKQNGTDAAEIIARGLSNILGISADTLYAKMTGKQSLDITLKRAANEQEYLKTLAFIDGMGLESTLSIEATNARYYPEGTLLAHALGFVGSDNQGLYGLEYYYDDTLSGTEGYYLYGKDANGSALPDGYMDIVEAKDGNSLVLTVDTGLQRSLEGIVEKIRIEQMATNRVCGVCMDIKTGAILAMATSSPFDPNSPYELDSVSQAKLDSSVLQEGTDEYRAKKNELLSIMWSNKAVSETYEPGSTFKIVTVSSALDNGSATVNDRFSCHGYLAVGGWHIRCHKAKGHGSGFNLAYGLQMSCNPCMMTVAERLGANAFYDYVEKFGYLERTGIDLPSEASAIFHEKDAIGTTELATASFGQRFKVSVIRQLTSICAVANGGRLMKPYIVDSVVSQDGTVISKTEPTVVRQVISESVASTVTDILEQGTSGEGGAKNAGVAGYKIAAKTGTSQKFDILDENGASYLRVGSCVAYSVNGDGSGIAVIIVTDEPQGFVKYGSVTAAPYASEFLSYALPQLGYETSEPPKTVEIPEMRNMKTSDAKVLLDNLGVKYEIVGDGDYIAAQTPSPNECLIKDGARVILTTEGFSERYATVPELTNLAIEDALLLLDKKSLTASIRGTPDTRGCTVVSQSVTAGCVVPLGSVIELEITYLDFED